MHLRLKKNWYRFHALTTAVTAMLLGAASPALAQVPAVTSSSNYIYYSNGVSGTGPCKIVIDAQGNIFFADQLNGAVDEIPAGQTIPITIIGGLQGARAVTFDAAGNLYVAGPYTPAMYKIPNENGTLNVNDKVDLLTPINETIVGGTSIDGYYMQPEDIAIDNSTSPATLYISEVYCSNCLTSTIFTEKSDGTDVGIFLNNLPGVRAALSMALDSLGNLYYTDNVDVWGTNIYTTPTPTPVKLGPGLPFGKGYANAEGISLDYLGNLWINDGASKANTLVVFPFDPTLGMVNPTNQFVPASHIYGQYAPGFDKYFNVYEGEGYGSGSYIRTVNLGYGAFGSSPLGQGVFGTSAYFYFNAATNVGGFTTVTGGNAASTEFATPAPTGKGACLPGNFKLGTSCALGSNWTPAYAGPRSGALELLDNNNNILSTLYLSGYGVGPQVSQLPGTVSQLLAGSATVGGSALKEPQAIAVDGSGDVFIADTGNSRIVEVPAGGAAAVFATTGVTLQQPVGLAVDGAGNLFIADKAANQIVKVTPANVATVFLSGTSGATGYQTFGTSPGVAGSAISAPLAVAIDQYFDVFVLDTVPATANSAEQYRVVEVTAGGFPKIIVPANTQFASNPLVTPSGLAVDGLHNLYVADTGNNRVVEYADGGVTSLVNTYQITLSAPTGVAVDAGGNLYITDASGVSLVTPPPAGGTVANPTVGTAQALDFNGSAATGANAIALDASGDVFVVNAAQSSATELNVTSATLTFAEQAPGSTSAPEGVTVFNNGNAALTLNAAPNPTIDTGDVNYVVGNGTCVAGATVAVGASCTLDALFTPTTTGTLTGSITLADNTVSTSQVVQLQGTAQNAGLFVISGLPSETPAGGLVTFTVTAKDASGNPVNGYLGTISFSSSDPQAKFYQPNGQPLTTYTFTSADNSVHTFVNGLSFNTPGNQTITVTDTVTSITGTSSAVFVEAPATGIAAQSGSGQSTPLGQPFANPLQAYVTNASNQPVVGSLVTFTAPSTGASGTFPGGVLTAQAYTNNSGVATSPVFTANATTGTYSVAASVSNVIAGTMQSASFTLNNTQGITSTSVVDSPPSPSIYGQATVVTATVAASAALANSPGPTGNVVFYDGSTAIATEPLTVGTGQSVAALTIPSSYDAFTLTAGSHTFSAIYQGDSNYLTSTSAATAAYTVSPSVSFITTPTPVAPAKQLVSPQGQVYNLLVTVAGQFTGPGIAPPTGTLTWVSGSPNQFPSGSVQLVNGVGTIVFPATTIGGSYQLIFSYSGDNNYQAIVEPIYTATVVISGFDLTAAVTSFDVAPAVTGTTILTLIDPVNYAGNIYFACKGLPTNASCSFTPSPVVFLDTDAPTTSPCYNPSIIGPSGQAGPTEPATQTVAMDIYTTSPPATLGMVKPGSMKSAIVVAGIFWLPGLLLAGLLAYRRKQLPAWGRSLMTALVLTCGLLGMSACGVVHQPATSGTTNFTLLATGVDCERGTTATITVPMTLTVSSKY